MCVCFCYASRVLSQRGKRENGFCRPHRRRAALQSVLSGWDVMEPQICCCQLGVSAPTRSPSAPFCCMLLKLGEISNSAFLLLLFKIGLSLPSAPCADSEFPKRTEIFCSEKCLLCFPNGVFAPGWMWIWAVRSGCW